MYKLLIASFGSVSYPYFCIFQMYNRFYNKYYTTNGLQSGGSGSGGDYNSRLEKLEKNINELYQQEAQLQQAIAKANTDIQMLRNDMSEKATLLKGGYKPDLDAQLGAYNGKYINQIAAFNPMNQDDNPVYINTNDNESGEQTSYRPTIFKTSTYLDYPAFPNTLINTFKQTRDSYVDIEHNKLFLKQKTQGQDGQTRFIKIQDGIFSISSNETFALGDNEPHVAIGQDHISLSNPTTGYGATLTKNMFEITMPNSSGTSNKTTLLMENGVITVTDSNDQNNPTTITGTSIHAKNITGSISQDSVSVVNTDNLKRIYIDGASQKISHQTRSSTSNSFVDKASIGFSTDDVGTHVKLFYDDDSNPTYVFSKDDLVLNYKTTISTNPKEVGLVSHQASIEMNSYENINNSHLSSIKINAEDVHIGGTNAYTEYNGNIVNIHAGDVHIGETNSYIEYNNNSVDVHAGVVHIGGTNAYTEYTNSNNKVNIHAGDVSIGGTNTYTEYKNNDNSVNVHAGVVHIGETDSYIKYDKNNSNNIVDIRAGSVHIGGANAYTEYTNSNSNNSINIHASVVSIGGSNAYIEFNGSNIDVHGNLRLHNDLEYVEQNNG